MKILIADDDSMSLALLKRVLEQSDHEVVTAKDGEEAWQVIMEGGIQLAIVDWMMPNLNGPTLCHRIRQAKLPGYVYIIMLTSRKDTRDVVVGLRSGADDYLCKPFEPAELEARLQVGRRTIERIELLQAALSDVKTLSGLLPICGCCKKIRDDKGYWNQIESFLRRYSDANFEHAVCPDCVRKGRVAPERALAPPSTSTGMTNSKAKKETPRFLSLPAA